MAQGPRPVHDVSQIELYPSTAPDYASVVELSQNESPFGPSPRALEALAAAGPLLHRYPDGSATRLREAIAARFGLDAARIVCGMASDSLITLLVQTYAGAGDEVLFPQHSFVFYGDATIARGAVPVRAPERDLRVDVDALAARASERTRLCILANPGNPTGTYITGAQLARLRERLPAHVLLVVDAAYCEYVTLAEYSSGRELVEAGDDTVMLRTFSKVFGLAGLRLGWAYCPPPIADALHRGRSPYNVSSAAAAAGIGALSDEAFLRRCIEHNAKWLERLARELSSMGLKPVPGVANFVLVEFPAGGRLSAADAAKQLREQGILVRPVARYGLPDHLRITVGTDAEMERLLEVLRSA